MSRRRLVQAAGVASVLAGLALNEWTIPPLFGRDPAIITTQTYYNIRILQGLAVALGLALLSCTRTPGCMTTTKMCGSLPDPESRKITETA